MNKGHTVRFNRVRRFDLPKGPLKWVPKDKINVIRPKVIRGPNLSPWSILAGIFHSQEKSLVLGQWLLKAHDKIQERILLKHEGHVTYGNNNRGRILGRGL